VLLRFLKFSNDLAEAEYVRAGMPFVASFQWSDIDGLTGPPLPPAIQIRELLHLLRPFVLEKEPTSMPRVCGILSRAFDHPYIRGKIKHARDTFLGRTSQTYYQMSIDDLVINSEQALQLWLNAFEYHRDEDKAEHFKKLHQTFPPEISKGFFLDLLADKVDSILWLSGFINDIVVADQTRSQ
jgi:hypothetical protein